MRDYSGVQQVTVTVILWALWEWCCGGAAVMVRLKPKDNEISACGGYEVMASHYEVLQTIAAIWSKICPYLRSKYFMLRKQYFIAKLFHLPAGQISLKKALPKKCFFLVTRTGSRAASLRLARLPNATHSVPASPLFAKNSSQDCFLHTQTLSGSIPLCHVTKNKQPCKAGLLIFGDPDGNRTRVTAVKGRYLNRLTTGPYGGFNWIRTSDTTGMNRML